MPAATVTADRSLARASPARHASPSTATQISAPIVLDSVAAAAATAAVRHARRLAASSTRVVAASMVDSE